MIKPTSHKKPKSPIHTLGIVIWILASLFYCYEFFLRFIIGVIQHKVSLSLHLNEETFAIMGAAYYITYGFMQIPVGVLADKFGVRSLLTIAALICAGATFMFAHSTGFTGALFSRLLMGLGSSFAFVCLLMIVSTWFPQKYFGFFAGASQFIGTLGPLLAAGPLKTLIAASHQTWRDTFTLVGFCGLGLAILMFLIIRNKTRDKNKRHIFLQPNAPLKQHLIGLMKNKQAWLIATYSATVYCPIALLALLGNDYLQARGLSPQTSAYMLTIGWLGYAIGCPLLGALSDISKRRKPTLVFCAVIGLTVSIFIVFTPLHHSVVLYSTLFLGLGFAASGQNIGFATIAEQADPANRTAALGLNNGILILSGAIVPPLVSLFILTAQTSSHQTTASTFITGFTAIPLMYLLSIIISVCFLKETFCKPRKETIMLKPN